MSGTFPILNSTLFFQGGTTTCDSCGQTTTGMRRHDPAKPLTGKVSLRCFTCDTVTTHTEDYDAEAFNSKGESLDAAIAKAEAP